jgi:hypothetical protein
VSEGKPKEEKKEQSIEVSSVDRATMQQLLEDTRAVRELMERIKESSTPALPAPDGQSFDPKKPLDLTYDNDYTRSVFETSRSSLARTQRDYSNTEARYVSLESYDRGLDDVVLDTQVLATRLEGDWYVNDQTFEHLKSSKGGGAGMWLGRHMRFLLVAIIVGVLGSIALVRLTDPQVLDALGTELGGIDPLHQAVIVAAFFSILLLIAFVWWRRTRSTRPATMGAVSQ